MSDITSGDPPLPDVEEIDLYREVHKGLRQALFGVVQHAGSVDTSDSEDLAAFRSRFAELDMMLSTHHGHEDLPALADLVSSRAPDLIGMIDTDHERIEHQLEKLRVLVADLDGDSDTADIHARLGAFTGDYLGHMRFEEQEVMPRLRAGATAEELMGITMAIRTSVPPDQMCVFLRSMLPAMNPDERTRTLGGMQAGAPPEIFEMFWAAAIDSLTPEQLAVVADRLAIPTP